ncbi:hypothetical protein CPC08DRAFT_818389 [Agrocybe pediades]|nr:hypothetical protein CPC08DRAFT_818389 [Agrocybe pediades]
MLIDSENATHLKPWLVRTLEPICDAEPGALADYILALLQHNVPENEMRDELATQLDEFLEKECPAFIDTLFTAIRTKSYLPYNAAPASPKTLDNGIPIPLEILTPNPVPDRSRKRNSIDDERDGRPPAKTQRLNNDGSFSRYGNGSGEGRGGPQQSGGWTRPQGDRFRDGGMGMGGYPMMGGMPMNGMGMMNGRRPQGYQPPDQKRGVCRDYHNNGYCARGATCKYSHGDDAVVPGQLFPGMPFMPMFPAPVNGMPFMAGGAYDPHEARMDMRPMGGRQHQRAPLIPRVQQEDGSRVINASGELPVIQDLTPVVPREPSAEQPVPTGDVDMPASSTNQIPPENAPNMGNGYNPMLPRMNGNGYPGGIPPMDMNGGAPYMPGMRPPTLGRGGHFRGRGGRGRGTFPGEAHNFRPEKRNDQTLVVEKIPEDKLSLECVNDWFKRFGTVTNVAIDPSSAKALVSFSNHEEAHAAWKSEEAVFNNRFVKVFWHRPMEGHGQVGARMLAASAPLVANMSSNSTSAPASQPSATPSTTSTPVAGPVQSATSAEKKTPASSAKSATLTALAEKQQKLEAAINEQKTLMASLSTASPEEKKEIMAKLRKLGEEMKGLTAAAPATTTKTPSPAASSKLSADAEHEKKEHERLDKELEMRNENGNGAAETEGGESSEDLKAKLERLKAEAASLGLDAALPSSSFRGYRGRGRGAPRAYYRGGMRGGPPRGSMKLDNRPKKLLIKGVSDDNSQALRDWYETTGQLESVEPTETSGTYIVAFKSRSAAEAGLAKGTNIPLVGSVHASWYTGKDATASGTTTTTQTAKQSAESSGVAASASSIDEAPRSPEAQEEEVASGWGNDDDEDGMGML